MAIDTLLTAFISELSLKSQKKVIAQLGVMRWMARAPTASWIMSSANMNIGREIREVRLVGEASLVRLARSCRRLKSKALSSLWR